jgi:allograft inflammatory factor 1
VDSTDKGTINYPDFLIMMLGGKNSVLRMILLFEEKRKEKPRPQGKQTEAIPVEMKWISLARA